MELDHQAGNALGSVVPSAHHADVHVGRRTARDERLGAIQNIIVAIPLGAGAQRCRVGPGARFGETITRHRLHAGERRQPFDALLVVAEPVDHPRGHIVDRDIGRGGRTTRRQLLEDHRRIEPAKPGAAVRFTAINPRESQCRRLAQGRDRKNIVLVPFPGMWRHLFGREGARGVLERDLFVAELEIQSLILAGWPKAARS